MFSRNVAEANIAQRFVPFRRQYHSISRIFPPFLQLQREYVIGDRTEGGVEQKFLRNKGYIMSPLECGGEEGDGGGGG